MTIFYLGTLAAGLIAACVLPFLPFPSAVVIAIVIGSVSMFLEGAQSR